MSDVDRIKERLSIVDVLSSYITLEKAGMGYKARCPFHAEKTPSFHISADRGLYYCFGCGAKGDIFSFVQDYESTDFQGALKILADKAGIELSGGRSDGTSKDERDRMHNVLERATLFFESNIRDNKVVQDYLQSRGIKPDAVSNFRIGYAPDSWDALYEHLLKEGVIEKDMETVGLIKRKEKQTDNSRGYYDRFRNRIMFPITDSSGRVVGFSGRTLDKSDSVPKYINSPETPLYNKSDVLFGYDKAREHIKKAKQCILVEGQIDLVLLHQEGFPYSVAVSGTSFTGSHLKKIMRLANTLVLAFDRDRAGVASMMRSATLALSMGMDVKTLIFPEKSDPADIVSSDIEKWKKIHREALHVIDVLLREIRVRASSERDYWLRVSKHVLPLIAVMPNAIDRSHFIKRVREETDIPEDAVASEIEKLMKGAVQKEKVEAPQNATQKPFVSRKESILKTLHAIILWQDTSKEGSIDTKVLVNNIQEIVGEGASAPPSEEELNEYVFRAEQFYENNDSLEKDVEELVLGLREESITERLGELTKEIRSAEKDKNIELKKQLLANYQELSVSLENVKQEIKSRII